MAVDRLVVQLHATGSGRRSAGGRQALGEASNRDDTGWLPREREAGATQTIVSLMLEKVWKKRLRE